MNNNDLAAMARAIGKRYGYEDATAQFIPIRDFKVRWTRTYKWISLEICDYLADAPEDVILSLMSTIFKRIAGEDDAEYESDLVSWLTAEDFVREKQPIYVRRFRGLSKTPMGNLKDLDESYRRLIDMGLVERDPMVHLGWGMFPASNIVARTSVIMKVVSMSDLLDREEVDDVLVDYCLYAQLARLKMGFNPGTCRRGAEYDALLDLFPGRYALERKLERMEMHI